MSAYLPIRELAGAMLPSGCREGLLMLMRGYFDDSGTHSSSDVVVLGGLIGSVDRWESFERAWAERLADPLPGYHKPPLEMFHLSACNARAPGSGFEGYNDAEQNAVIRSFREIVIDPKFKLISSALAIDRRAWDEFIVGDQRKRWGEPLSVCFEACIDNAIKIVNPSTVDDQLAVIFDKGIWSQVLQDIADPFYFPRLVSVNFARMGKTLPLQGADMVATENYWHAIEWLKRGDGALPRAHLRHYLANMLHEGLIWDREKIEEVSQKGLDRLPSGWQPS